MCAKSCCRRPRRDGGEYTPRLSVIVMKLVVITDVEPGKSSQYYNESCAASGK